MFSLDWLFGSWAVDIASEILSFSSNCLYVGVLLHFEKVEFALDGLRQFFVDGEIEEVKLKHVHETCTRLRGMVHVASLSVCHVLA